MGVLEPVNRVVSILMLPGLLLHEATHRISGMAAGGQSFVSNTYYGIPDEIDFQTADRMSEYGIRLTGGSVVLYPLVAFGFMGSYILTTNQPT